MIFQKYIIFSDHDSFKKKKNTQDIFYLSWDIDLFLNKY